MAHFGVGLIRDDVVVNRPALTSTAEGDPAGAYTTVLTTNGTWGAPTLVDQQVAAQRGVTINAVLAMETADIRIGDRVIVRSHQWDVVGIKDVRYHMRVMLREIA